MVQNKTTGYTKMGLSWIDPTRRINFRGNGSRTSRFNNSSFSTGTSAPHTPSASLYGSVYSGQASSPSSKGDRSKFMQLEMTRGVRHLSYWELMHSKAQGLCFRCGERYHPLHQCTSCSLRLLVFNDEV